MSRNKDGFLADPEPSQLEEEAARDHTNADVSPAVPGKAHSRPLDEATVLIDETARQHKDEETIVVDKTTPAIAGGAVVDERTRLLTNEGVAAVDANTLLIAGQTTGFDGESTFRIVIPPPVRSSSRPSQSGVRGAELPFQLTTAIEDLSNDRLLTGVPREELNGHEVPVLGGIPLIARLGQGGMGTVYIGVRVMLQQEVAVKVLSMHLAALQPQAVDRFLREAYVASRIESPHLVRVTDVGETEGLFYLVQEYVRGVSAGQHLSQQKAAGRESLDEAEALEICIAAARGLAEAHEHGVIHRDVKPDNILIPFDRIGKTLRFHRAKLADLGLARGEEADHSLTIGQTGMGTPGYMAPEQALSAKTAAKPADVFGLGATLYAFLSGRAPFTGDSTAGIIMATVQTPHMPIRALRRDVSSKTAELIDRCLEKSPEMRLPDATSLLHALEECRDALRAERAGGKTEPALVADDRNVKVVAAPAVDDRVSLPVTPPRPFTETGTETEAAAASAPRISTDKTEAAAASTPRISAELPPPPDSLESLRMRRVRRARHRRILATIMLILGIAIGVFVARGRPGPENANQAIAVPDVRLSIAYNAGKADWLDWAVKEFRKTPEGRHIDIRAVQMEPSQVHQQVVEGAARIDVWCPSSQLLRGRFVEAWKEKYGREPFAREAVLTLKPHVFLIFEDRYQAFRAKFGELTFSTLRAAYAQPNGWASIAGKPAWGRFKFALLRPDVETNGLTAMLLIGNHYFNKDGALTKTDLAVPGFGTWLRGFDRGFKVPGSSNMALTEMVRKGPSVYDGIFVYESTALEKISQLEGRWGKVRLVYPHMNIWNESSLLVLDAPWVTSEERKAANAFLDFLLSTHAQKELPRFGFEPAKTSIPTLYEGSPFVTNRASGVRSSSISITIELPAPEVIDTMIQMSRGWYADNT